MENMDFFCELFNGALHIEAPRLRIIGWIADWKGFGKNWQWPNRDTLSICLEGPRKTTKTFSQAIPHSIIEPYVWTIMVGLREMCIMQLQLGAKMCLSLVCYPYYVHKVGEYSVSLEILYAQLSALLYGAWWYLLKKDASGVSLASIWNLSVVKLGCPLQTSVFTKKCHWSSDWG
jgi:hypothetical protein